MELVQLTFERDVCLNNIQRMADCIDNEAEFRVRSRELNNIKKQFTSVQCKIEKILAKKGEFNPEDQIAIRDKFDNFYYLVQIALDKLKISLRKGSVNVTTPLCQAHSSRIKLPTISLPTFSGNVTEWNAFYDLFKSLVHDNEDLSDVQRFRYLLLSLRDEPFNLIKSFPVTDSNYQNALLILINRYQNKRIIATKHFDKIYDADPVNDKNLKQSLRNIINMCHENFTALDSLGFPVQQWSFPLLNILLRKITPSIRRRFELSLKTSSEVPPVSELLDFLEKELAALEVMSAAKVNTSPTTTSGTLRQPATAARMVGGSTHAIPSKRTVATAPSTSTRAHFDTKINPAARSVSFHSSTNLKPKRTCYFCNNESHTLNNCESFHSLDLKDRKSFIKENKICINCLFKSHEKCLSRYSCKICSERHHTKLHDPSDHSTHNLVAEVSQSTQNNLNSSTVLLTTALVNIKSINSNSHCSNTIRALVDQGSQATLITESCVQRLGLQRFRTSSSATVTGIGDKDSQPRGYVMCEITPYNKPEPKLFIEALILPRITSYVPTVPSTFETMSHLQNLPLADPDLRSSRPVELLLGSDYTDRILLHNIVKGPLGTPVAINSIFGYLLNGRISPMFSSQVCVNVSTYQLDMQIQKFWELESIPEVKPLTKEEILCESIYVTTHSRDSTGKYTVSLPFKENTPPLGDSRETALSRLHKLELKLSNNPALRADYIKCLQEYIDLGHMEPVHSLSTTNYYIPHFPILKQSSATTKVRIVYDASSKTTSGRSLNDNLLIGPKLQQDIVQVLLKYRLHNIVFTSDIKMMYRYIDVRDEDRDFQRILWRNSIDDPVQEYRLCTVTFGVASAPFLALRTLRQLAQDESLTFPLASQVLLNDVFVDDIVTGAATLEDALKLQRELTDLCKAGTFELRKWTSNSSEFLSSISNEDLNQDSALILSNLDDDHSVKILGLQWNPRTDTFSYQVSIPSHKCTKRIMLSEISKIYDPLGFLAPITLLVKHLIQLLWVSGVGWDDQPPQSICELWSNFISEFSLIENISLSRHILPSYKEIQIHGFSDSSEKAYAGCVYLRVTDQTDKIHTFLIIAKTKVSPLKRISLPRLELCGAVLVSKLIEKVLITYGSILPFENVFAWSDSSITLAWLRSPSHEWRTYVANRVTEVTSRVPASQWRHVRSADNPADVASRGVLPSQLNQELWFTGPSWLKLSQHDWPVSHIDLQTNEERRKHTLVSQKEPQDLKFLERFSSLSVLLRVVSLCFRFYHKCRKSKSYSSNQITVHETKSALHRVISLVQNDQFSEDIIRIKNNENCSKRLQKLRPFLDTAGILRVGGRIQNAKIPYDAKHQILLPKKHFFTDLLIDHFHKIHLHVGPQTLQFLLSQSYWILSARDAIRMRTRRCVRCFRTRPTAPQPIMAQLPAARVRSLRPFLHVAVDFAGHFYLKSSPIRRASVYKSYVAVFVCMSTKAVHLELVSDLSTIYFVNALRRLISRRGICSDVYSDCGRNFVGCDRYLKELFQFLQNQSHQEDIQRKFSDLTWHFNPPYASHFGGIFEAAVKSMKSHLYRVIGNLTLSHDEFTTLLCQIEAILNSRPLCLLSNDPSDPLPLTPGHFLIGEPLTSLPEYEYSNANPKRLVRWQVLQQSVQHFWKRWSVEYLQQLQPRGKWFNENTHSPLREGSVVVLIDNSLPPLQWRLARVHQLHPGVDGVTRVVTVRMGNTFTKRPVVKVCPLPIE